ncbi:MAG: TatD family hydrolase [Verrucomicrobiota bacterium]
MNYIEPHAHMVSRTTDDYVSLVTAGCLAVCEPAFWAGFDRSSSAGFYDYFCQLTKYEPQRAAKFGLPHYCWLCLNPKEAENLVLAKEVLEVMQEFIGASNVLGIGEIGLNKNSKNELKILERQIEIAIKYDQLILVHTPHLEDKLKGTKLIIDCLLSYSKVKPEQVIIDHVEEHTVQLVLDKGFWAGITLYPESKCTFPRAVDMIEQYGKERIWMNSACDWGVSDPIAVPKAVMEMRKRGFGNDSIEKLVLHNPCEFLGQSSNFVDPRWISNYV